MNNQWKLDLLRRMPKKQHLFEFAHTVSFETPEETLTILGELDSWRRGKSAEVTLFVP